MGHAVNVAQFCINILQIGDEKKSTTFGTCNKYSYNFALTFFKSVMKKNVLLFFSVSETSLSRKL